MRKLVTIRIVSDLVPIEGADRIEIAKVDGWQCIVQKGDFRIGELGLFFEIDSVLPSDDERFSFLEQRKFRIKSMKLRGALSQGLLMPMTILTEEESERWRVAAGTNGETLTEILRVQKYEVPVPIGGEQKGNFPTHLVPKTDQERVQNIPDVLEGRHASEFEITEKLDGTSCTIWYHNDGSLTEEDIWDELQGELTRNVLVSVASRNWEMKTNDENAYAKVLAHNDLVNKLCRLGRNIAIQGEIIGPRVQGNKYKRATQEFYVFDIYDIDEKRYLWPMECVKLVRKLDLLHVPILPNVFANDKVNIFGVLGAPLTLERVLDAADGKSQLYDTKREGIVFKHYGRDDGTQGPLSFKAVSNKFLLKNE
jgi:RNA ligase (TIGR02306 family)